MTVRTMTIDDYKGVHDLWMTIKGCQHGAEGNKDIPYRL